VCTLCRCKFSKKAEATQGRLGRKNIVELAEKGDWVVGTGGASKKSAGHGKLIYAMRVDKKLTRWDYFIESRFEEKKPERPRGEFQKHKQFALVSRYFYYFGANAIDIPKRFDLEKNRRGFHYVDPANFRLFLEWLEEYTNQGNTGNRGARPLVNQKGANDASRPTESRDRHRLRGNSRPAVRRRFI